MNIFWNNTIRGKIDCQFFKAELCMAAICLQFGSCLMIELNMTIHPFKRNYLLKCILIGKLKRPNFYLEKPKKTSDTYIQCMLKKKCYVFDVIADNVFTMR